MESDGLYPCNLFDKTGSCTFGDQCKFSHLGPDDPGLPSDEQSVKRRKRKRNGICLNFARNGVCDFGENCRYKHAGVSDQTKQASEDALQIADAMGVFLCFYCDLSCTCLIVLFLPTGRS